MRIRGFGVAAVAVAVGVVVSCLFAVPVLAAGEAPAVDGESVSGVTPFKAFFEAQVNPHEEATTSCVFEYGTSTAYGSSVPCEQGTLEGGEDQFTGAGVSGLEPGTVYHFRVVVENATGKTEGGDSEFTTLTPEAPIVDGESVSSIAPFSATLEAQVNPDDQQSIFFFEYALNEALSGATTVPGEYELSGFGDQGASVALSGLERGTTYYYRVIVENATGKTEGVVQSFTTVGLPTVEDQSPTATNITHRSASLWGTVDPGGAATTYHFEYGTTESYGSSTVEASAGEAPGDVVVGPQAVKELEPGTVYHYRLLATSAAGTSTGADHTFTTGPALPPLVLTGEASGIGSNTATVSGTVDPQGLQTAYEFDLGVDTTYGTRSFGNAGAEGVQAVGLALTGLVPGATYHYRLCASNEDGTTCGQDRTFTTQAIPYPLDIPVTPLAIFPGSGLSEIAATKTHGNSTTPTPSTKAQKLRKALKACRKKPKHKRAACRRAAIRRFR